MRAIGHRRRDPSDNGERPMSFETTREDSFVKQQDSRGDWKVKINLSGQLQPPIFCRDEAHADEVVREQKAKRQE
jgi:hypothetical protein